MNVARIIVPHDPLIVDFVFINCEKVSFIDRRGIFLHDNI